MSATSVCDALGKTHELMLALKKAGFDDGLIQQVVNSKDNKHAKAMYYSVVGEQKAEVTVPTEKFALLADLGYIIVPEGDPATCLTRFAENNREKCYGYNNSITDANFPKPTRILKPGDKLHLRAFKQAVSGTTMSEERMDFLRKQKGNVFVGAQGATYAFEQKRDQLPKGYSYASFDEKDALWEDAGGSHRVPGVDAYSVGDFKFYLGYFEYALLDFNAFFCFCDESSDA